MNIPSDSFGNEYINAETALLDRLFSKYNASVRPRYNSSEAIKLDIVFRIESIENMVGDFHQCLGAKWPSV